MKEAILYEKLENNQVRCNVCNHRCLILPGNRGLCGVRENQEGKLYSLVYGKAVAVNIDPIEKKPLFHFLPGTLSYSFSTVGCNLQCAYCQNWTISQGPRLNKKIEGFALSPKEIVKQALENNCPSISYTYTEPTIFLEYALETMKLAKEKGLKNVWVSNGYMSEQTLNLITPYLDAINVDLKFFKNEFYQKFCKAKLEPILENLKKIKKNGIWLEITTLVIPTLNDKEKEFKKIAEFIKRELGAETPWHISKFSPEISWQLQHLSPTPDETVKKAREIGIKTGLKYVYSGNLWDDQSESTYCPKCQKLVIKRVGFDIQRFDKNGKCKKCGGKLDLTID